MAIPHRRTSFDVTRPMSAFLSIVTTLRHGRTRWPGLATCHRIPRPRVISYGHALPARSDPPARRGLGHRPAPQIRTGALPAIYLFCPMPSNGNPQLHDQGPSLPSGGVASTCPNEGQNPVPHVRLLLLLASLQLADVCPRLLAHTPNSPPEPHPSRRPRPGPPHPETHLRPLNGLLAPSPCLPRLHLLPARTPVTASHLPHPTRLCRTPSCAVGTTDNSPAIHRWDPGVTIPS